jgi:methylated-DNA-[protein]-cysteine S-methyltransferase
MARFPENIDIKNLRLNCRRTAEQGNTRKRQAAAPCAHMIQEMENTLMNDSDLTLQSIYESPLGPVLLAVRHSKLRGIWFQGQRHEPDTSTWIQEHHPLLDQTSAQLAAYFSGQHNPFDLPLDFTSGTPFQQAVWQGLLQIPRGATSSYSELSAKINKPMAVRAVGGAVGRNPFSIVVPCHRVIGAGGALTGYAGGLDRKRALLQLEGATVQSLGSHPTLEGSH